MQVTRATTPVIVRPRLERITNFVSDAVAGDLPPIVYTGDPIACFRFRAIRL